MLTSQQRQQHNLRQQLPQLWFTLEQVKSSAILASQEQQQRPATQTIAMITTNKFVRFLLSQLIV
jgi:hypothetical protein